MTFQVNGKILDSAQAGEEVRNKFFLDGGVSLEYVRFDEHTGEIQIKCHAGVKCVITPEQIGRKTNFDIRFC